MVPLLLLDNIQTLLIYSLQNISFKKQLLCSVYYKNLIFSKDVHHEMLRSQSFIYLAFENQAFIVHQLRYWSRGSFFYRRETTSPNYSKDSTNKLSQCHVTRRLQSGDELSGNTLRNRFQYNNSDSIVYIMWNRSGTDICRKEKQNSVKNSFISFIVSGLYSYSRYRLELACKWGLCSSSPLPRVRIKPDQPL